MSLPAMLFGDRFCVDGKGGTGGGGWMHPKGTNSMAVSGFSFGNTLIGSGWATSVLLCTNGLRKRSCHLVWHPFPAGSFIPSLDKWLPGEREL